MSPLTLIQSWTIFGIKQGLVFSVIGLLSYLVYNLAVVVYNVFFHPLGKFPGPRLAAASSLPKLHALVRGELPRWVKGLHDEYNSDVVRISPTELSFINPAAWNDIYNHRPELEPDRRSFGTPPNGVDSLVTANNDDHARMRKVLNHSFTYRDYKAQEPVINSYVEHLISSLFDQVHGPDRGLVDMANWYHWLSFDIIGDLVFGSSFNCLDNHSNHPWVEMIFGNMKSIILMSVCNRFMILRHLLRLLIPKKFAQMRKDHWAYTVQKVDRRLELGSGRRDFMTPILQNSASGKALTREEIHSNMSLFLIAGSETVATVLIGATYFLAKNPRVLRKLIKEIGRAFQTESEISVESIEAKLPYLLAVLAETSRIYPTAVAGRSRILPPEGAVIAGHKVPGKTGVAVHQYAAYRSRLNFSEPDVFIPERWLDDPQFVNDNKKGFYPFSLGARICIGKLQGQAETRLVLAKMLWNFNIELSSETPTDWEDQKAYTTWQKKPLIIKLSPSTRTTGSLGAI